MSQEVAAKLTMLKGQGVKVLAPAVRALAAAERQDALIVLQALAKRGKAVTDPTLWILNSLKGRGAKGAASDAASPGTEAAPAKAPVAKVPAAQAGGPAAKAPVAKTPAAKAPVTKAPAITKAPVAKTPAVVSAAAKAAQKPRLPPQKREGLEFEQMAAQAKLFSLNSQKIWPGADPLDESALAALLKVEPARALEILDEAEEKGLAGTLQDPSAFARRAVALELQTQAKAKDKAAE